MSCVRSGVVIVSSSTILPPAKTVEGEVDMAGVYRYSLRLQAYVGLLNDQYPPFALS